MNKKRLSVVMAGAMLASSVAPVLAAEVVKSEHSANELGLLQEELRELLESKVYSDIEENKDYAGHSVYAVYVNGTEALGKEPSYGKAKPLDVDSSQEDWQYVFNGLNEGDKVEVYSKGFKEEEGKVYAYETVKGGEYLTYSKKEELEEFVNNFYLNKDEVGSNTQDIGKIKIQYRSLVESARYDDLSKEAVVKFKPDTKIPGLDDQDTLRISINDKQRKFKYEKNNADSDKEYKTYFYKGADKKDHPMIASNPVRPEDFYGFALSNEKTKDETKKIESSKLREIMITAGGYNLNVSDLYDGLFLTEKGYEFFGLLKDSIAARRGVELKIADNAILGVPNTVYNTEDLLKKAEGRIKSSLKDYNGIYKFEVVLGAKDDLKKEVYTITGKDKSEVARLAAWMLKPQARVDKFEGSNRYETAVLLAKEYAGLNGPVVTNNSHGNTKEIRNIVLVNGNALVDGLAAAPLASSIADKTSRKVPMLLTEADHLPKATVKFLKELMADHLVGNNKSATIHLVGGESVLNKSLEKELRGLGFKIERYDGDNREETSLLVMDAVRKNNGKDSKAFVVGAEGEADAMSISAVAADQKTPIVVAKKGGISEDAVYELKGMDTTIVGGKTVVTARDENALREEAKSVNRIYGDNRKATNAKVIEKYYNESGFAEGVGRAQNVIVAKDGQRRPIDLVDALAATNMAATKKAPIVLATSKLSKEQESAINSYAKDAYGLFQVGGQVNKEVVRTIAKMLNLTNR